MLDIVRKRDFHLVFSPSGTDMTRLSDMSNSETYASDPSWSFVRMEDFSPLDREDWARLAARRTESAPFVDETWMRAWIGAFAPKDQLSLCLRRGGRVAGLAFMVPIRERWTGKEYDILHSATNDWSYRYEFLAFNDDGDVYGQLWAALFSQSRWDVIRLDWIVRETPTMTWGLRAAREHGWSAVVIEGPPSPWRRLPASGESWNDGLKTKFKSNLRNRERRIQALGKTTFTVVRDTDSLKGALRTFYEVEAKSWKGEEGTAIAMQPGAKALFDGLLEGTARDMWIAVLSVGDTPVAAQILRVRDRTMFLLKTAYDPEFAAYSPGQLITARVIQDGIERGMDTLDFLGAPMDWKSDWVPELRPNVRLVFCSPSVAGRYAYWSRFGIKNGIKKLPLAVPFVRRLRGRSRSGG
jgi:CelD/BcsL family acetyltransferase involved in cellulose biosynthesis